MVRVRALVATAAAVLPASVLLVGCGEADDRTTTMTSTAASTSAASGTTTTVTSTGGKTSTRTPVPDGKTPLYVALRMDDIQIGYLEEEQVEFLTWFSKNKVKFNYFVITSFWGKGSWPGNPGSYHPAAQEVQRSYDSQEILGTGPDAFLEMGTHAYDHENWPSHTFGQNGGRAWQESDMKKSLGILRAAYPNAAIRSFATPLNAANAVTVQTCLKYDVDILSTQANIFCDPEFLNESSGCYNYGTGPCGNTNRDWEDVHCDCVPPDDTYYTTAGMQKANGLYSTPAGSANSDFADVNIGLSVDATIGVGKCGCEGELCSLIANAVENSRKSNGLHWTVLMMHPQTKFQGQTWTQWLDEFLQKVNALDKYDVIFVNMQDLVKLKAPSVEVADTQVV